MNCPLCAYQSPYAATRCPGCQTVFSTEALETLWHLVYLRERLLRWRIEGVLSPEAAAAALTATQQEISTLHAQLVAAPVPAGVGTEGHRPDAPPHAAAESAVGQAGGAPPVETAGLLADGAYADDAVPEAAATMATSADHDEADDPDDGAVDIPAAAPGPAFAWRDVGTYLLSERTLHGLLGLGALLILASGVVISTLNPTGLGPLPHLGAVIATTLLFFVAGYVVRQRLKLTIAGATLLGIAGAFVPMTIWTLGQERLLNWEPGSIWLVASLVSLPLYLAVHRILRDRVFAVLAAFAGGSVLLAMLDWLTVPLEWGLAGLVLLAIGYVRLGWRLRDASAGLGWALAWSAQAATPGLMLLLLVARVGSDAWLAAFGRPLSGWGEYAIGAGWWLGTLFYVQSGRLHRRRWDAYAAAWTLPVAYLLTLTRAPWGASWYGLCLGALALAYLLAGTRRLARTEPPAIPPGYVTLFRSAAFQVAAVVVLAAAFWPLQTALTRIVTLGLLAGLLVLAARLLRLRAPAWIGMLLLGVAFGLTLEYQELARDTRPLAWAILAAVLLAAGEVAVRRTGEGDRRLWMTVLAAPGWGRTWQSRLGAPLFAAGYVAAGIALWLALGEYWQAPAQAGVRRLSTPAILGFVAVLATLTASSVARRTGFFLYVVPWLALIPLTAGAAVLFEQIGWSLHEAEVARLLAGASVVYLVIAVLSDRHDGRYARPLYLACYLLLPGAMLLSLLDRATSVQVVGAGILAYAASAWLTHVSRLRSWDRLVMRVCGSESSAATRTVRTLWVYLAVWLLPAWVLLLASLWEPAIGWYALILSGLALLYPAVGRAVRRVRTEYRWPFYLGGYALSAIAPLVALTDTTIRPVVLALSMGLYVASAVVGRRSAWLYPVAVLGPVLLWQALGSLDQFERWYGVGLVVLAAAYGALGIGLQPLGSIPGDERRGRFPIRGAIGPYALPFLVVGYVLVALGLARAANQEAALATLAFGLATLQFAASAVVFRQPVFGWATAGLALVVYVVGLTLTPLDPSYRGLGLLPAGALALLVAEVLRRRVDSMALTPQPLRGANIGFDVVRSTIFAARRADIPLPVRGRGGAYAWCAPWYVLACGIAVAVPFRSTADRAVWTLGWWGSALLFGALTALPRHPLWLFPALGFGTVAYLATGVWLDPSLTTARSFATLAALAWLFLGLAWVVERRGRAASAGASGWTVPLHVAGWVTALLACLGSLLSAHDGLAAALAVAGLTVVLGLLRGQARYAWGSVALLALAFQHGLRVAEVMGHLQPVYWAGASVATVVLAQVLGWATRRTAARWVRLLTAWVAPLTWASALMAAGAALTAVLVEASLLNRAAMQSLALTLAIVGVTAVGHAYERRERRLVYLGVGLLEIGLLLELLVYEVGQLQAFALPVGLYLLGVAYLEWRRGTVRVVKRLLEAAGLIVLLGISLIQAVGFLGNGYERYVYDTFLLLESAVLLVLGAVLRWRYTFFAAALALVLDVGILLVDPLKALNTWYLVALIGLTLIGAVIWIERQRQKIPTWIEGLRARLEQWD